MSYLPYLKYFNPLTAYRERDYLKRRLYCKAAESGFPLNRSDKALLSLKDKHKGRRCFIIGNGPSLRISDLDRLKNEITFASNKIYLAFDSTDWRPDYYSVIDVLVAANNAGSISQLDLDTYATYPLKVYFKRERSIIWIRCISKKDKEIGFSKNLLEGVCGGATVIYAQLQMAYFMGIKEVYLIGLDFKFNIPSPTSEVCEQGIVLDMPGGINHFHPKYRMPGEKWTIPKMGRQKLAFIKAKEEFEADGRYIYNSSRQTALDVLPRVNIDQVLSES